MCSGHENIPNNATSSKASQDICEDLLFCYSSAVKQRHFVLVTWFLTNAMLGEGSSQLFRGMPSLQTTGLISAMHQSLRHTLLSNNCDPGCFTEALLPRCPPRLLPSITPCSNAPKFLEAEIKSL